MSNEIGHGGPTWSEEVAQAKRRSVGRQYRVPPTEHVGHIVTLGELEPPDPTHVLCRCECGANWAMDGKRAETALERHEVKG